MTPLAYVQGQVFDSLIEIPSNLRATWGTPSLTRGGPPSLARGDPPPLRVGDPLPYAWGTPLSYAWGTSLPHIQIWPK